MIRAIVWKELREQGLVALTLVVLGAGVLAAVASLADPPVESAPPSDVVRSLGAGRLATLMLAVTAGMVCGGAVFAAEREAGTFAFLDSLPSSRWRLWLAKLAAGLGLALAQIGLLVAAAAVLGLVARASWAVAVTVNALLAFVWGMFGSTASRTTLGAVGVAIPAAAVSAFAVLFPIMLLFPSRGGYPGPTGSAIALGCMFVIPVVLSAWIFTGPDRARSSDDGGAAALRRSRAGVAALLWLSARQLAVAGPVLSAFALLFGLALTAPGVQPFAAWPGLALAAGVLAGVTAFADEQTHGAARFWGEQRLPVGRAWAVKIALHLAFCAWLLVLLAAPLVIRAQTGEQPRSHRGHTSLAVVFRSPLFDELGRQGWKYLLAPAAYGFAAGHVCGLVFRKLVVACGVAGIVGGVGAAAWGPSVLAGGLRHWQVWLPPAVALLTGRLLIRAWAADRIPTRGALATLAGGCAATALVLAAGLAYRVLEIPDRPGSEDDIQFVAGLTPFDQNLGGRDFKTAAERYVRTAAAASPEFDRPPAAGAPRRLRVEERLEMVPRVGWPAHDPDLAVWLDRVFADAPPGAEEAPWHAAVAAAAERPIGIFEYPQLLGLTGSTAGTAENARRMAVALLARGLQRQAGGDPAAFLPALRATLALGRTVRNGSVTTGFVVGSEIERLSLVALDRWLDRLPGARPPGVLAVLPGAATAVERPDLLRAAADLLADAEPTEPFDPTPYFLAERHLLREGLKAPAQWLPALIAPAGMLPDPFSPEVELVGLAWAVPWERERTRRLVGLGFESGLPDDAAVVLGRPGLGLFLGRSRSPVDLIEIDRQSAALRRAGVLKTALRAFRAERGNYPDALAELTAAGYLRRLPPDPFDEARTFGYRVSKGETLTAPSRVPGERVPVLSDPNVAQRVIPPGQAVVWSVAHDKLDQGGTTFPVGGPVGLNRPPDLVYLVPIGQTP